MNKGLDLIQRQQPEIIDGYPTGNIYIGVTEEELAELEKELKEAEENKAMLDIFKNALTVERAIPPELEIKESEKGNSYVFKEAVKIHEIRIEEMYKKALREWVLKNAFPKELKAFEIIKENLVVSYDESENDKPCLVIGFKVDKDQMTIIYHTFDKEKIDLLKEVLIDG